MDMDELRAAAERITLSAEARARIARNCRAARADAQRSGGARRRRLAAVAVAAALCLGLAATAYGLGRFRDVTRWDGAVVGTEYGPAAEELDVRVLPAEGGIEVLAAMTSPETFPWRGLESLGLGAYRLLDGAGDTLAAGEGTAPVAVADGEAQIFLPIEALPGGDYTLVIDSFVGGAKGDQPLPLLGPWTCPFTV